MFGRVAVLVSLLAAVTGSTAPAQVCFRGRRPPRCKTFFVTEVGLAPRLSEGDDTDNTIVYVSGDLGLMVNAGRFAYGGTFFFGGLGGPGEFGAAVRGGALDRPRVQPGRQDRPVDPVRGRRRPERLVPGIQAGISAGRVRDGHRRCAARGRCDSDVGVVVGHPAGRPSTARPRVLSMAIAPMGRRDPESVRACDLTSIAATTASQISSTAPSSQYSMGLNL